MYSRRKRKPSEQVVPAPVPALSPNLRTATATTATPPPNPFEDVNYPIPNFDHIYDLMRHPKDGFDLADRRWRLVNYSKCFIGNQAVQWMVDSLHFDRNKAIITGQTLMEAGIIHHVTHSEPFCDEYYFYRFQEDDDGSILNMKRVWDPAITTRHAVDVSKQLLTKLALLIEEHRKRILTPSTPPLQTTPQPLSLSQGDDDVDYSTLAKSTHFRNYVLSSAELQRVQLLALNHYERIAFFVNVYNLLVLHAHVIQGPPNSLWRRYLFFRVLSYRVAGLDLTLDDIEHGILRGNKRPPMIKFLQQLRPSDPKCQHVLPTREPRIHFLISAGTRSDPPIRLLDGDDIHDELHHATVEFLSLTVKINETQKTVSLPRIFYWYADDFPHPEKALLKWVAQHLPVQSSHLLYNMLQDCIPTVTYDNFDWSNPEARFNAGVVRRKRRRLERERSAVLHIPFMQDRPNFSSPSIGGATPDALDPLFDTPAKPIGTPDSVDQLFIRQSMHQLFNPQATTIEATPDINNSHLFFQTVATRRASTGPTPQAASSYISPVGTKRPYPDDMLVSPLIVGEVSQQAKSTPVWKRDRREETTELLRITPSSPENEIVGATVETDKAH